MKDGTQVKLIQDLTLVQSELKIGITGIVIGEYHPYLREEAVNVRWYTPSEIDQPTFTRSLEKIPEEEIPSSNKGLRQRLRI